MDRVRSDRQDDRVNGERSHRRKKRHEEHETDDRRMYDYRRADNPLYQDHQDDISSDMYQNEYPRDDDDDADRYHTRNPVTSSRNNKPVRLSTTRHRNEDAYVNAPYVPDAGNLNENMNPHGYFEETDNDNEQEVDEYSVQQSLRSEPFHDVASNSQNHPPEASRRYRSRTGNTNPAPSIDSMSDYGQQHNRSLAGSMPNALGGNEQEFWNPDIEPKIDFQTPPPHQTVEPEATNRRGLQKFLASFRRLKKPKGEVKAALSEQNLSTTKSIISARVIMLDGEEISFQLDVNDVGQALLTRVCETTDLVETDYFGLTYRSNKIQTWFWLDVDKKITKQLRHGESWLFCFQVKFYPPEPTLLQEDITRYQLALQVRQDIYKGKLPCSWVTQALLGSFLVQSELGDYDEHEHGGSTDYLNEFEFVPAPTQQLLQKITELHKTHKGMTPNQADIKYLETAKRLELYGMDLHPARDMENIEIYLGVGFHGMVIYRDRLKIGRFAWPKILRISYKKNNFFLKIRPDHSEPVETIIGFRLLNHNLAERLWKVAVEHHAFFRLKEARSPRGPHLSLNSWQNYTGHTFFEYRTMNINRPHPQFERSLTKRRTASMPMGLDKSPSIHTLNRSHPRDMTIGRTQNTEQDSRFVGTPQSSMHQSNRTNPRGNRPSSRIPHSEISQQYSDAADQHSLSYASSRGSRMTDIQRQQYANQKFASPRLTSENGSVLSGSFMSGDSEQGIQNRVKGRRMYADDQNPTSPLYANAPRHKTPNTDRQRVDERTASGRKPPAGSVPALGGVMLNEQAMPPQQQRRRSSEKSGNRVPRPSYSTDPADYLIEEPDELEYDDDLDNSVDYYNADPYQGPDSRLNQPNRMPPSSASVNRNGMKSNRHTPRRSEQTELML